MAAAERAVTIIDFDAGPAEEGARRVERAGQAIIASNRSVASATGKAADDQAKAYERSARATEMAAAAMRSAQSAAQTAANMAVTAAQAGAVLAGSYNAVSAAVNIARRNYTGFSQDIAEISEEQNKAASAANTLTRALTALGLVLSARQYIDFVDSMSLLNARIGLVTKSTNEFLTGQRAVYTITQETAQPIQELGELYTKVATALTPLGLRQAETLNLTETIAKAMKVGGGEAAGQAAALVQLGQAFSSGTLRGEELNSVLEQAPRLARAIAEGMGISTGALRSVAEEGKITSVVLADALRAQKDVIAKEFAALPITVSAEMTRLNNAVMVAMAQLDKSAGISSTIGGLVNNLVAKLQDQKFLDQVGAILNRLGTYAKIAADAFGFLLDHLNGAMLIFAAFSGAKGLLLAASAMNTFTLGTKALTASLGALGVTATATQTTIAGLGAAFALSNPISALIALLSAAGIAYLALADHSSATSRAVNASNQSIDATRATVGYAARSLDDLAASYNRANAAARGLEKTNLETAIRRSAEALEAQRDVVRRVMADANKDVLQGFADNPELFTAPGLDKSQTAEIRRTLAEFFSAANTSGQAFADLHLRISEIAKAAGITEGPMRQFVEGLAKAASTAGAAQENVDTNTIRLRVLTGVIEGASGPTYGLSDAQYALAQSLGLVGTAATGTANTVAAAVASMQKSLSATGGDLTREIERAQAQLVALKTGGVAAYEAVRREQAAFDEAQRRWTAARQGVDDKTARAAMPERLEDALKSDIASVKAMADGLAQESKTLADKRSVVVQQLDSLRKSASASKTEAGQIEKNEKLVDTLQREFDAREQSERAMAIEAATRRLNAQATDDERREVEALAGSLYDLKAARDQDARMAQAQARLQTVGMTEQQRDAYLGDIRIVSEATRRFGETVAGTAEDASKATWISRERNIAAAEATAKEAERYAADVKKVSEDIGKDISENLFDRLTDPSKATDVFDFFKTIFKRIAVEALNTQIVMPIVTQVVGSVPGLFGVQAPVGGQSITINGQTYTTASGGGANINLSGGGSGFGLSKLSGGWLDRNTGGIFTSASNWLSTPIFGSAATSATGGLANAAGVMGVPGGVSNVASSPGWSPTWGEGIGGAIGIASGAYQLSQGNYVSGGGQIIGSALTMAGMPEIGIPLQIISSLFGGMGGDVQYPMAWYDGGAGSTIKVQSLDGGDTSPLKQAGDAAQTVIQQLASLIGVPVSSIPGGGFTSNPDGHPGTSAPQGYSYFMNVAGRGWDNATTAASMEEAVKGYILDSIRLGDRSAVDPLVNRVLDSGITDTTKLASALTLAQQVADATAGLDSLSKSLEGVTASAKKTALSSYDPLKEQATLADEGGFGTEFRSLIERQIRAGFDPATTSLSEMGGKAATITGNFDALREAVTSLGLSISETEIAAWEASQQLELRNTYSDTLTASLNTAQDKEYLNQADTVAQAVKAARGNINDLWAGDQGSIDTQWAKVVEINRLGAQKVIDDAGLVGTAFTELTTAFATALRAEGMSEADITSLTSGLHESTAAVETGLQTQEDLWLRLRTAMVATGAGTQEEVDAYQRMIEQRRELVGVTDAETIALIKHVHAAETAAAAAKAAETKLQTTEDLHKRLLTAQVATGEATQVQVDAYEREVSQRRELVGVTDASTLAMLKQVHAAEDVAAALETANSAMETLTSGLTEPVQAVLDAVDSLARKPVSALTGALSTVGGEATGPRVALLAAGIDPGERPGITAYLQSFNLRTLDLSVSASDLTGTLSLLTEAFGRGRLESEQYGSLIDYVSGRFADAQQKMLTAAQDAVTKASTARQSLLGVREEITGQKRGAGQVMLDAGVDPTVRTGLYTDLTRLYSAMIDGTDVAENYAQAVLRTNVDLQNNLITQEQYTAIVQSLGTAYQDVSASAKQMVESLKSLSVNIKNLLQDLQVGDLSTLDPSAQMGAAKTAFEEALTKAAAGDENAISRITGLADAYLKASQAMYASSADYVSVYNSVTSAMSQFSGQIDSGSTAAQTANDNGGLSNSTLMQINQAISFAREDNIDALKKVQDAIDLGTRAQQGVQGLLSGSISSALTKLSQTSDNPVSTPIVQAIQALQQGVVSNLELLTAANTSEPTDLQKAVFGTSTDLASLNAGGSLTTMLDFDGSTISQARRNAIARTLGYEGDFGAGLLQTYMAGNADWATQFLAAVKLAANPAAGIVSGAIVGAHQAGGIVGAYEAGGIVGNGIYDVDSVIARYAGGGNILLAGGEHVTRATSVTAETLPWLSYVNATGRLPAVNDALPSNVVRLPPIAPPPARQSGNSDPASAEILAELRQQNALLKELARLARQGNSIAGMAGDRVVSRLDGVKDEVRNSAARAEFKDKRRA